MSAFECKVINGETVLLFQIFTLTGKKEHFPRVTMTFDP